MESKMSITSGQPVRYASYRSSEKHVCPKCGGLVYRIPRRFIDRCFSLFVDVRRYRCLADCGWEGNLSLSRAFATPQPDSVPLDAGRFQA
jgi:predicted RNA-binding Zn-ribbon protein involved in translation (DUF1610 family)